MFQTTNQLWKIIEGHIAKIIEDTVILQNSLEHVVQTNAAMILQELYGTCIQF